MKTVGHHSLLSSLCLDFFGSFRLSFYKKKIKDFINKNDHQLKKIIK